MTVVDATDHSELEALAARLEDPRVAAALASLLDNAELIAMLVTGVDEFLRRSGTILDSTVDSLDDARRGASAIPGLEDLDLAATARAAMALMSALPRAAGVLDTRALEVLTAPETVQTLQAVSRGLSDGSREFERAPVQVTGVLSVVRLLRDPDLRRALSLLATVGRQVGRSLAELIPGRVASGAAPDPRSDR